MEKTNCFFCGSECKVYANNIKGSTVYECDYCGKYELTRNFIDDTRDDDNQKIIIDDNKHIFAGYLEETKGKRKKDFVIGNKNYEDILDDSLIPKTIMQKLEKLLLYCYNKNQYIGQQFTTNSPFIQRPMWKDREFLNGNSKRIGIAYTKDKNELDGMIKAMQHLNWVEFDINNAGQLIYFVLTVIGLSYAEKLLTTNINSNKAFVAMAFSDGYEKKMEEAIKPACEACGFKAFTIDEEEFNGDIVDQIITKLKRSKFVIADLTYDNSGAYYEAGYAAGMRLEVIKCCQKDWFEQPDNKVHFDLNHDKLILYSETKDFEESLKVRIRATIGGAIMEDKM